ATGSSIDSGEPATSPVVPGWAWPSPPPWFGRPTAAGTWVPRRGAGPAWRSPGHGPNTHPTHTEDSNSLPPAGRLGWGYREWLLSRELAARPGLFEPEPGSPNRDDADARVDELRPETAHLDVNDVRAERIALIAPGMLGDGLAVDHGRESPHQQLHDVKLRRGQVERPAIHRGLAARRI